MLTRKHFESIAESIALIDDDDNRQQVIACIMPTLIDSNPRFQQYRFESRIAELAEENRQNKESQK